MPQRTPPEDCLQLAIDAAGGNKIVGAILRPEMDPVDAGKWLARCLDANHKQRLNYAQERLIYGLACNHGAHEGFAAYAEAIGYRIEPIDRTAEIIALQQQAERRALEAGQLTEKAKALMQAVGLKVEGM